MNGTKYPRELERITKDGSLARIKIPYGWLVLHTTHYIYGEKACCCSESMLEIRDIGHHWELEG